jgi:putative transposase
MRRVKGRSARKLLMEFPVLGKRYWGGHMWSIGYGAWSAGNVSDAMVEEYLDHHKQLPNHDDDAFILE